MLWRTVPCTVRQSTFDVYGYMVHPHIVPGLGRLKLKCLNPAHVRAFYRDRLDSGLSPATVHKMHVVLHKALDGAVSDGLIPRNAAKGVKVPQAGSRKEIRPSHRSKPATSSMPPVGIGSNPSTSWPSPPAYARASSWPSSGRTWS